MQVFVQRERQRGCKAQILADRLAVFPDGRLGSVEDAGQASRSLGWLAPIAGQPGGRQAVLFVRNGGLLLNGREPPAPAVVLRHGDHLRWGGRSVFFTDEAPLKAAPVEPDQAVAERRHGRCARRHRPMTPGEPVVHCPVCGTIYMAQADKDPNCWTFGPCLVCQPDPRGEFVWRPEEPPRCGPRPRATHRARKSNQEDGA